jgi:hypothetical protein
MCDLIVFHDAFETMPSARYRVRLEFILSMMLLPLLRAVPEQRHLLQELSLMGRFAWTLWRSYQPHPPPPSH